MKNKIRPSKLHYIGVYLLLLAIVFFAVSCSRSKNENAGGSIGTFRILGYLFSDNNWQNDLSNVNISQLTDVNLAFIDPDTSGNFQGNEAFTSVVATLSAQKIRVYFSIGGGDPPAQLEELIKPARRIAFINHIVQFSEKYSFSGVDVDLENELINDDYPGFVAELSTALRAKGKLMTAALASWNANEFHDSTLNRFDFINIMSYDKTGPWNTSMPGAHSPFQMAVDDFNYYNGTRGIASNKLLIGLPFYGYGFGNNAPPSISYNNLILQYPGAENSDSVTTNGGKIYYNGLATIEEKVKFAKSSNAAGVMIWQLMQDSRNNKSLLNVIYQSANK